MQLVTPYNVELNTLRQTMKGDRCAMRQRDVRSHRLNHQHHGTETPTMTLPETLASNSVPTGKLFSSYPPITTPTRKSEGAPIETRMGARIDSNPNPTKNPTGPLPRPTTPLFTPPSRARVVNLLVLSVILCVRRRHVSDKTVPICFQVCCPCQHSRLQQQPSLIFRQLGVVTARTLLQC